MKPSLNHSTILFFLVLGHAVGMGILADVPAETYAAAGANQGKFAASETVPDFSAACVFIEDGDVDKPGKGIPMGSGVLIAPNLILTAAHIVVDPRDPTKNDLSPTIQFGPEIAKPTSAHTITSVHLPPIWESKRLRQILAGRRYGRPTEENLTGFHDVAIVVIDPPATNTPAAIAPVLPLLGSTVWFAGYGDVASGEQAKRGKGAKGKRGPWGGRGGREARLPKLRHAAQNTLDRVIPEPARKDDADEGEDIADAPMGANLLCDFDNGTKEFNRLSLQRPPRHLSFCRAGKSAPDALPLEATCHQGDSGGPMFARIGDQWVLIGVCGYVMQVGGANERRPFHYGEIFSYASVPNMHDWIRETQKSLAID